MAEEDISLFEGEVKVKEKKVEEKREETLIFTLRTSIGYEKSVAESIIPRAKRTNVIYSILCPETVRGYIFIEASDGDALRKILRGFAHTRELIRTKVKKDGKIIEVYGTTSFSEIEHFLTPKLLVAGITEGDIVEIITSPFKGEKARVKSIDETKEEITVELLESTVPIPVTLKGDQVRVLDKER